MGAVNQMIRLTRVNGEPVVVNADLIELLEASNEVVVVLTTGRRLVVRETADQVIEIARSWQQSLRGAMRPPLHVVQERMEDG